MDLGRETATQILDWIGVDLPGRLITQVSRFDGGRTRSASSRPTGSCVREVPELQLALVGSMALDDPEGWDVHGQLTERAENDPQIHIYTNLTGASNVEVNAFQRLSEVVVQKSIREGFGLVVSESLWKGTPVVAGRAGGIPMQMPEGIGGLLVDSVEDCAGALLELLRDRELSKHLGHSGRDHVREHFLLPRLLLEELRCLASLDADGLLAAGDRHLGHDQREAHPSSG